MFITPPNELDRLKAIHDLGSIHPNYINDFDSICRIATNLFRCQTAMVNVVFDLEQYTFGKEGTDLLCVIRDHAFCAHTILSDEVMVVEDAQTSPVFASNPLVTEDPGIRFYAGAPLTVSPGINIGALCLIDREPRTFSQQDRSQLQALAEIVVRQFRLSQLEGLAQDRQTRLTKSEQRLKLALESGSDGIWEWYPQTELFWCSDRILSMLGYDVGELEASLEVIRGLSHPADLATAREKFGAYVASQSSIYEMEQRMRRKDGSFAWIWVRGKIVEWDAEGEAIKVVGTHLDISHRKNDEARINHLAFHDTLTDLPNRRMFRDQFEEKLAEESQTGAVFAVLFGDLDRFKTINDTLGHAAGDAVLTAVADRFRSISCNGEIVSRVGGDEFAIIQTLTLHHPDQAADLARRLIDSVREPILSKGRAVQVGLSLGICMVDDHTQTYDEVLQHADLALLRAKAQGGNTFRFYDAAMDEAMEHKLQIEIDMHGAVERREFELHYQPLLCLKTGMITGAEALIRWRHPTRGLISPADFIPVAEETGLIHEIGVWALHRACRDAATWPERVCVAVNVSPLQFRQGRIVETVLQALQGSGLLACRLNLEITESLLLQEGSDVLANLNRLHNLGISISLDDFGTGYSSLSYLRKFQFDKLKIDRSFISQLDDPGMKIIVSAIVDLGHGLGMKVVAEGVETADQLQIVNWKGCDEVQGYFVDKPMLVASFRTLLNRDPAE